MWIQNFLLIVSSYYLRKSLLFPLNILYSVNQNGTLLERKVSACNILNSSFLRSLKLLAKNGVVDSAVTSTARSKNSSNPIFQVVLVSWPNSKLSRGLLPFAIAIHAVTGSRNAHCLQPPPLGKRTLPRSPSTQLAIRAPPRALSPRPSFVYLANESTATQYFPYCVIIDVISPTTNRTWLTWNAIIDVLDVSLNFFW